LSKPCLNDIIVTVPRFRILNHYEVDRFYCFRKAGVKRETACGVVRNAGKTGDAGT
jgi:hypothetical protein